MSYSIQIRFVLTIPSTCGVCPTLTSLFQMVQGIAYILLVRQLHSIHVMFVLFGEIHNIVDLNDAFETSRNNQDDEQYSKISCQAHLLECLVNSFLFFLCKSEASSPS